jgi:hypothetical protein
MNFKSDVMKKVNTLQLRREVNAEINSARITHEEKTPRALWEQKLLKSMKGCSFHRGVRIR